VCAPLEHAARPGSVLNTEHTHTQYTGNTERRADIQKKSGSVLNASNPYSVALHVIGSFFSS